MEFYFLYPECDFCLNRELDPFQCKHCRDASHFCGEDSDDDFGCCCELPDFDDEWR